MAAQHYLITGGCGFIGLNLIAYLQKHHPAIDITVLDNLSMGKREFLDEFDVKFVKGDIQDFLLVNKALKGIDVVIHLAADTSVLDSIERPDFNFNVNVVGTYNLLRAARDNDVEHFVMASTGGAIIGEATPPVHEEMPPRPMSPYGASKLMAEGYLSAFSASYGMKTVALRFSNVYGKRSYHKGSVVAKIFKDVLSQRIFTVFGDGLQTRDYVFVEDLSEAVFLAAQYENGGETIQLGTAKGTSLNDVLLLVKGVIEPSHELIVNFRPCRVGEVLHNYTDISKAKRILGYKPKIELNEGLIKTWGWFLENNNG